MLKVGDVCYMITILKNSPDVACVIKAVNPKNGDLLVYFYDSNLTVIWDKFWYKDIIIPTGINIYA
jgi:hypothetical protein